MSALSLENTWAFWTSNMRGDPEVQFVSQFDSIQMFWEQFKAKPVNGLPDKTYLHVFKGEIKPLWEDPSNYSGGHFKLTAKSQTQSENMWLSVLLNMLGEQFPNSECVNGASIMSNQVGNNLVKVWLATTDKLKVQATREFLRSILDSADYLPNVTFVPHKLVVKGAGKKVSSKITEGPVRLLATPFPHEESCNGASSKTAAPGQRNFRRKYFTELTISPSVANDASQPCTSPYPRSPESTVSLGLCSFGGALSSIPSSRCSEFSSMPPSPRPISPTASYTGSEWEADCGLLGMKLMPPSPAFFPQHAYPRVPQRRSWSVTSQDYSYTHNPYSLANSLIYSNTSA